MFDERAALGSAVMARCTGMIGHDEEDEPLALSFVFEDDRDRCHILRVDELITGLTFARDKGVLDKINPKIVFASRTSIGVFALDIATISQCLVIAARTLAGSLSKLGEEGHGAQRVH